MIARKDDNQFGACHHAIGMRHIICKPEGMQWLKQALESKD
jgi:hypothetical protein